MRDDDSAGPAPDGIDNGEPAPPRDPAPQRRPRTYEEAVALVLADLSPEAKASLKALKASELIRCHFGLAMAIRNVLGLWTDNDALLLDCARVGGDPHPDEVSNLIVRGVWQALQEDGPR